MSDEQMPVKIAGDTHLATLAQISQLDITGVEAFRGGRTPAGVFHWRVKECNLGDREFNDSESETGKTRRPYVELILEATNVESLALKDQDPAEFIGIEHRELMIVRDFNRDVGRYIALLEDSGFTFRGNLADTCDAFQGHEFIAPVKHTTDRNDKDRVYANLVYDKVAPMVGAAPATPTAPAAALTGLQAAATPPAPAVEGQPAAATAVPAAGIALPAAG